MKYIIVSVFLILSFTSSAFKWGGYLGGTYTLANSKGLSEIDTDAEFGRDIAFAIKQKLLGPISVEVQLGYKSHDIGFITDGGTTVSGTAGRNEFDLSYEYLYVRPLIHYKLNKRFSLLGGLTLANTISAEQDLTFSNIISVTNRATSIRGASEDFRIAINLGVEMKIINLGIVDLAARLFYEQSLTDAADVSGSEINLNSLNLGAVAFF